MTGHRIAVGSRKGLLMFEEHRGDWRLAGESHLGAPTTYAATDSRDGTLYACLQHGHWGAKLQRSRDAGRTWQEIPAPKYPEGAKLKDGRAATLLYPWCLAFGDNLATRGAFDLKLKGASESGPLGFYQTYRQWRSQI